LLMIAHSDSVLSAFKRGVGAGRLRPVREKISSKQKLHENDSCIL
jgi:hypothetical protein